MQWNNDNASASQNAGSGLANLANFLAAQQQLRQLAQTEYLVRCFKVKPPGINVLDARLAVASLRKQYGIQTSELATTQTPNSQTDPMSGSYLGSGTSTLLMASNIPIRLHWKFMILAGLTSYAQLL